MKTKNNNPIFLQGRKTILRPLNKETDLELCWRWFNDQKILTFLISSFPQTKKDEEKWFDELSNKEDQIVLAIETKKERVFIGTMGLNKINWPQGTAVTGAVIGNKAYWGKGFGTDAKMTLLNYAFNTLGLRKICSAVIDYNKRSLQYSQHCGYQVEGRLKKQVFKNGEYRDEILLGLFKEYWEPIWQKYQKTGRVK